MPTLSEIDKQIADLEGQKQKLIEGERKAAVAKVQAAIAELNALGFTYSLAGGSVSSGARRTGIRKEVLDVIEAAKDGISRSELLDTLQATSKSAKQSVSNALSALKKAGSITSDSGHYNTK